MVLRSDSYIDFDFQKQIKVRHLLLDNTPALAALLLFAIPTGSCDYKVTSVCHLVNTQMDVKEAKKQAAAEPKWDTDDDKPSSKKQHADSDNDNDWSDSDNNSDDD